MKRIFIGLVVLLFSSTIFAQDILLKEDGTLVECKIKEVTSSSVKYLKFSDLEGPVFVEEKSDLIGVMYKNGDFEKITASKSKVNKKYVGHRVNLSYLTSPLSFGLSTSYEGFTAKHFSWSAGMYYITDPVDTIGSQQHPEVIFSSLNFGLRFYTKNDSGAYGGVIFSYGSFESAIYEAFSGLGTILEVGRQFQLSELFGLNVGYSSLIGNYSSTGSDYQQFLFDSHLNFGVNFTF